MVSIFIFILTCLLCLSMESHVNSNGKWKQLGLTGLTQSCIAYGLLMGEPRHGKNIEAIFLWGFLLGLL